MHGEKRQEPVGLLSSYKKQITQRVKRAKISKIKHGLQDLFKYILYICSFKYFFQLFSYCLLHL